MGTISALIGSESAEGDMGQAVCDPGGFLMLAVLAAQREGASFTLLLFSKHLWGPCHVSASCEVLGSVWGGLCSQQVQILVGKDRQGHLRVAGDRSLGAATERRWPVLCMGHPRRREDTAEGLWGQ